MSFEEKLTNKEYYKDFIDENGTLNPVQILGERYFEEQNKEVYDLSEIRFVQGELYFHFKDFETAIFKWESIKNELEPWAKKNMADAFVELGIYANAEDLYTSIVTDSIVLKTEIGLQLFSLYIRLGKHEKADAMIKKIVSLNPDYPTVTDLAQNFYEENKDWKSAVDLAVKEGVRNESVQWFTVLKSYVNQGFTKNFPPEYFEEPLLALKNIHPSHFEQLLLSFWKSYENDEVYLTWVKSLNNLFNKIEIDEHEKWFGTQNLFQEIFYSLVNGTYFIKDIEHLIPDLLKNWIRISDPSNAALAFGAVLAWNDYFPITLEQKVIENAELFISNGTITDSSQEESQNLLSGILQWGRKEAIDVSGLIQWNGESINLEEENFLSNFLEIFPEEEKNEKLLLLIKELLKSVLDKKEEQKKYLIDSIDREKEILSKLNGAVHQLDDMKFGKNKVIKKAFQTRKEEIKVTISSKIPEILKSCSEIVKENSDFKNIHIEINDEMNQRIQHYLNDTVLPMFHQKFQDWVKKAEIEFQESKFFIDELREGLNLFLDEDVKLNMECDFQVLKDWKRDMERMTSFVSYEKENIFLRFSPSQFLLKSAGKLLGALPQNKGFLVSQYKKLIENEDYTELVTSITNKFLQQLDLFERTLERDVGMFFQSPIQELKQVLDNLEQQKERNEKELRNLKSNPEQFYDPVILFQIRHRQLEWLNIGHTGSLIKNKDHS